MKFYEVLISNLKLLSEDVIEITLKIPDGEKLEFKAGQFIILEVSSNPKTMRAYSVLDYNEETNELKVAIKKVENGQATTIIFNSFKVGQKVSISSPTGNKLIVDKNDNSLLLVATGIGITPILCILNDLIKGNYKGEIELLYGARTLNELYYKDEIADIARTNSNVKFTPVLSREVVAEIETGYVTDVVKNINLEGKTIYMCSSNTVAKSFKETLESLKFDLNKFNITGGIPLPQ